MGNADSDLKPRSEGTVNCVGVEWFDHVFLCVPPRPPRLCVEIPSNAEAQRAQSFAEGFHSRLFTIRLMPSTNLSSWKFMFNPSRVLVNRR